EVLDAFGVDASATREGFSVESKGTNDLVTDIDVSIETFLQEELREIFPRDTVVGEELETAEGEVDEPRTWLIDPIDGTLNFSRDIPMFCVSIALQDDGESVVGVIYDPRRDELFSARTGHGAHLDGRPLEVTDTDTLGEALLVTGFPRSLEEVEEDNVMNFARLTRASRGVRRLGSAALDLAYVAAGRLDGFWEYYLKPWDTAAGYLLVREAGGEVTAIDGGPFDGHQDTVLATNGQLHDGIIDKLSKI
ncbi:MAG: inositol monophosphatase, partial [Bradymonadaceae bacterium]